MQRVMLNLVYPNALYVQGAVDEALRAGMLRPAHFTRPGDFFALQRTTRNLRRFAGILANGASSELPVFSMVLMGPVLWTRFVPGAGGLAAETHVAAPLPHRIVIVTDVPALAALVQGDVSGQYANASGLVRFYGDPAEIESLHEALVAAFPGASEAGLGERAAGAASPASTTAKNGWKIGLHSVSTDLAQSNPKFVSMHRP